mgnify:CR=1 FL=1
MKKKKEKSKNQAKISQFFGAKNGNIPKPVRNSDKNVTPIVLSSDDDGPNVLKRPRVPGDTPPQVIKKSIIDKSIAKKLEADERRKRENVADIEALFSEPRPSSEPIPSQGPSQGPSQAPSESDDSVNMNSDDDFDDELPMDVLELCSQPKFPLSNGNFTGRGKVVRVEDDFITVESDEKYYEIKIDPDWCLQVDDIVHGPPTFGSVPIAHSDTLVSCTGISTAAICPRHAVLADRFRGGEMGFDGNKNMLLGNMLHELVQDGLVEAVSGRMISVNYIKEQMGTIMEDNFQKIITCGESLKSMEFEAAAYYSVVNNLMNGLVTKRLPITLQFTHPDNINRTKVRAKNRSY